MSIFPLKSMGAFSEVLVEQEAKKKKAQRRNTRFLFLFDPSEVMPTSIFKKFETRKSNEKLHLSITRLY
ncbi:hypothetical protein V6Z05_17390 [Leptospira venezuelensis]|uniref:hypothetical protein n=1 Tax=Leptospira venezuelensis TaxID=1958811 RepID=UPI000A38E514|nr:hypothetical protein [Leptospira venezuelensis]